MMLVILSCEIVPSGWTVSTTQTADTFPTDRTVTIWRAVGPPRGMTWRNDVCVMVVCFMVLGSVDRLQACKHAQVRQIVCPDSIESRPDFGFAVWVASLVSIEGPDK